jgi:hypothetical protein
MRFTTKIATLVVLPIMLMQTPANALPCDNTRWCAQYSGKAGERQIAASSPLSSAGQR